MTTSTITMLLVDADDTIAAIERARDALERAKSDAACHCCGDLCPYAATARADAAALLVIDSFLSAARAAAEVA